MEKSWIFARNHQELAEVLLEHLDITHDSDLVRLAAACLDCEVDAVMWVEDKDNEPPLNSFFTLSAVTLLNIYL
ncbi:hypothetical protein H2C43_04670 [Corynebacterium glutamicum]|uniref:Uncharacterized protein n=1 Tax=Corynebacterium glutamicum (strain ATCC 13032 / DSM 20300 / JCM 1318 / BCRC 11384 / CCUG 27702 / LMG 3730 / NBRC 12168 / NCIMB 10025 / NRRL B-2784 / 534) TaxID=196627 RepID=Q8NPT2_CORGL|nr:hypothetical protein [Corynebacterium glutamicum]ARV64157.1 hypothetical protein B7P23_04215 [Corynebacterium glutamicum]AUI01218.1 hypothetical protein CYL77_08765 [Corynebacterium glutamicum]AUI04868.1 hypothetical protein C0I99_12465 [Corynebacterium glutamicum]MBA4570314.1 hypothetical protein [Corynebacterium glutamicum]MBA4572242.1 hypothetical protein [Corynebacterium glutamicum]